MYDSQDWGVKWKSKRYCLSDIYWVVGYWYTVSLHRIDKWKYIPNSLVTLERRECGCIWARAKGWRVIFSKLQKHKTITT